MRMGIYLLIWVAALSADPRSLRAGVLGKREDVLPQRPLAKPAQFRHEGKRRAIALFAKFHGEYTGQDHTPSWAADIFDPQKSGSFSHFYDTMSFGKLQVRGEVPLQWYASAGPASAYMVHERTTVGKYGQFAWEILKQADQDIDFSAFDSDGPDGVPNSGDDDGVVDIVFIVTASAPPNFLFGPATGMGNLGFEGDFVTDDAGASGGPVRIASARGTIQRGYSFAEAVGSMCHEYGHVLGLPDLYNTRFLSRTDALPEEDSAGIGNWGLMGWGASGWHGNDGPNSFCAWSRMMLGWSEVRDALDGKQVVRLRDVGQGGAIVRVPLAQKEYFLLEHRRQGSYYDRHIPGEGLLIWHVSWRDWLIGCAGGWTVDLECADGRWQDAGYPLGQRADSRDRGDNLDFWAHDGDHARQRGGNLGDATDPFDGVRFTGFTPETNPSSHSEDGSWSARIENIRFEDGLAIAETDVDPIRIAVQGIRLLDDDGDGVASAGEECELIFGLRNDGGLDVPEPQTQLHTDDEWLEIVQAGSRFRRLRSGGGQHTSEHECLSAAAVQEGVCGYAHCFALPVYPRL